MSDPKPIRNLLRSLRVPLVVALCATAFGCSNNPVAPPIVIPLDSLSLSPDTLGLRVGQSGVFVVTGIDTAGQPVTGIRPTWATNDTDRVVISISSTGRITAIGEGNVRVYATSGGALDSAEVVVRPQLDGWFSQDSNANGAVLNGVFFQDDGRNGWAVGDGGKIVATVDAGENWSPQVSTTAFNLNSVWFSGPLTGWAVGHSGTLLRTTDGGLGWTRVNVSTSENFMDVVFVEPDKGWVVGSFGVILRTRDGGTTWQKLYRTGFTLHSVSFADTSNGWAVGDNGVIVGTHDGGASWFVVPAITAQSFKAVWRRSASRAWAVGAQGVTAMTVTPPADTVTWQLDNVGAQNQLEGVCFPTDQIGFAVGYDGTGTVLRTSNGGVSWTDQAPNTQYRLNDVYFIDTERGWAVGANGTIVHTGTGGAP